MKKLRGKGDANAKKTGHQATTVRRRDHQPARRGAQRFGLGDFASTILLRNPRRPDELDRLAATVNTMAEDIQGTLDAKRGLLLAISHELRSPLTRARLNLELLPGSADATPYRAALLRDLTEMNVLVGDLLESERLAGRHGTLQRESVDLAALCSQVIEELLSHHPAIHKVNLSADHDLPCASCDRSRVRLLLRNLLGNALKLGGDANQMIEVHLTRRSSEWVQITVRDHGPGVPPEWLSRLSEPFQRPDHARTRSTGVVGLGLYLSRLLAQAHGGSLSVTNAHPGFEVTVVMSV